MINITSPSWWVNMFITTLLTMMFIFIIKKAFTAVHVPVVSDVISEV